MARYIDADELYKAAQKRIAESNEARMAVVDDEFLDLINDAFTEDVAPRAEWISVEDRWPETDGYYLVWNKEQRKIEIRFFHRLPPHYPVETYPEIRAYFGNCSDHKSITHWMPLPEPPKAKQPKDLENFEKKRLLPGDCFNGEIWCMCPYCLTGIEVHSIPKDRICHNCGKEYLL